MVGVRAKVIVHRALRHDAIMRKPINTTVKQATLITEREVKKRWPRGSPGTSTSWRSIKSRLDKKRPHRSGFVETHSGYGAAVEGGRRAGAAMPPPAALLPWVRRAGLPAEAAFPIARAIGQRGIPPKHAFRDGGKAARKAVRRTLNTKVRIEVRDWRRRAPRGKAARG